MRGVDEKQSGEVVRPKWAWSGLRASGRSGGDWLPCWFGLRNVLSSSKEVSNEVHIDGMSS